MNRNRMIPKKNIIGPRLAEARHRAGGGISQLDLARKITAMGVRLDRSAVAKVENGLRGVLDYELLAISKVLGVDPRWLLTGKISRN